MPPLISAEDDALLSRVEELGESGLNQTQIAEAMGLPLATLRSRIERAGLRLTTSAQVRSWWDGRRYRDLRATGEIAVAPEKVPA